MMTVRNRRAWMLPAPSFVAALTVVACGADPGPAPTAVGVALDEVFDVTVIELEEGPEDSIATPGIFAERAAGGFLLSDGQLPRVRSYDEQGRIEAAFGRFGEGPFEFRGISGLAEESSGRVAVVDAGQGRLTYLTGGLRPDTVVRLPGVPRGVEPLGEDLVLYMPFGDQREGVSRFFERPMLLQRWTANGSAWSAYRLPYLPIERSYWGSIGRFSFAAAGDSIYVGFSLRYPITILNSSGDSIGEIGVPPATFQPVPVFEPNAFNPGAYATQMPELLGGSGTISHIAVVDSHLVVVHGRFGYPESGGPFGAYHSSLDIYDRYTGRKLYEEVPLPEDSRVLGGGRHLYLLQNSSFPPWRVAKLSVRAEKPG